MHRHLYATATAVALVLGTVPAFADMDAARRWVDSEFQPSTLSKDAQLKEMEWFINAAKPFVGMDIKVVSETITTHEYEARTLAKIVNAQSGGLFPATALVQDKPRDRRDQHEGREQRQALKMILYDARCARMYSAVLGNIVTHAGRVGQAAVQDAKRALNEEQSQKQRDAIREHRQFCRHRRFPPFSRLLFA